jgi:chaperonin GroEL
MSELKMEHLGRVGNILVTKEDTFIDGIEDVTEHIKALQATGEEDDELRASRLNTKTARYFVGAHSESALSYRRLKVEDVIGAAYQALNGGIVPGGGLALYNASQYMPDTTGGKVLATALLYPTQQIAKNAGFDGIPSGVGGTQGLDTRSRQVVNMLEAGITDPKNVVYNAVKNAISVASTVITAPTLVTLPRMEATDPQPPAEPVVR